MGEKGRRVLRALAPMAPGLLLGLAVAALPEPVRTRVAGWLYAAGGGAIAWGAVLFAVWLWRGRAMMAALVSSTRRTTAELSASVDGYHHWRGRLLASVRAARVLHAERGEAATVALYDGLIAELEGASAPGGDA